MTTLRSVNAEQSIAQIAANVAERLVQLLEKQNTRARISTVAIRALAFKAHDWKPPLSFYVELQREMEMRGYLMGELARGGFGVIATESLSGAPTLQYEQELDP